MDDYRTCFLCGRNGVGDPLEGHHIFGAGNRKKSTKYGLVVDLCGHRCHRGGEYAAHRNAETQQMLKAHGQRKYMEEHNATVEDFIKLFGKNYLED